MAEERAQRRLAAILAADVVGYRRLMQLDEAGTLATLRRLPILFRQTRLTQSIKETLQILRVLEREHLGGGS